MEKGGGRRDEGKREEGERRRRATLRKGWDLVLRALCEQARNSSSVGGSSRAVLFQEKKPPNNITLGEQYWEINPADGDREGEGTGGRGWRREEGEPRRRTTLREGAILYYVPWTNRRGISPTCRVAHGRFFSRTNNHPTISSSANNTGKLILRTGTGRARARDDYYYYDYYDYYDY